MAKQQKLPHLTDDQLRDMLDLASASDSVELKLTVPEDSYSATARALGMDPLEARIRQIFFFDTPELTLNKAGLVVRALIPEPFQRRCASLPILVSRSTPCPVAMSAPAR